jgi:hypothetical protein
MTQLGHRPLSPTANRLPEPVGSMEGLGRIERADSDVISVRVSERKLRSSSAGIHMWFFFQPADERAKGCVGRAASRFRDGLYTTKAAASAATPPKKYLRTDYCRKNHEPGCYGHLFTLASGGSLVVVC